MRRTASGSSGMTLSLPPFTPMVTWLLGINTAVYLAIELFTKAPATAVWIARGVQFLWLQPVPGPTAFGGGEWTVMHGAVWQLVTYAFLHLGFQHWFGNMIGIWMFGAAIEGDWGTRRFTELFGVGVIGAGVFSVLIALTHALGNPWTPTIGASGGVYAILIAFGMVYADNEIMMIPFPFLIRAKYLVAILIVVTLVLSLTETGGVAYMAHIGGLLSGYLYTKFFRHGGFTFALSEGGYGLRNRYYKWKRRRAAKKFEVYMNKHKREDFFDEYGNYKGPGAHYDDNDKSDGRGPWVN